MNLPLTNDQLQAMKVFKCELLFQIRNRPEFSYTQIKALRELGDDVLDEYENQMAKAAI